MTVRLPPYKTNWFFSAMKAVLAFRPCSWFFSHTLHVFDRCVTWLSRGRQTFTELLGGAPVITLTTIGARSGLARRAHLLGLPHGERIILIASNYGRRSHPAWYFNLKAHPDVLITYRGQSEPYRAVEVESEEREQCWRKAVECYRGYENYRKWAGSRRIPVISLIPSSA